ncbi:hypothetical protein ACFFJY_05965 [Fictibacillus aquaticus]|uniref:Type VII secretion protein EssA n=1 Tax=Fictibacillus aquaticus TaxID=2021314 RepID=A0A235FAE0_9BACL|nr:hypothetical protein [Fictibacillus aquaticus]OYD58252.1 hypothetical protein CGZ90_10245 [Fictibacillus aquaticus]
MKKLMSLLSLFALVLMFATGVSAAEASKEMTTTIEKGLKDKHKDFKEGSLELSDVQTFSNGDSELEATEIVGAVATYKTVRDNVFSFDRTEIVYFNPDKKEMLTEQAVAKANPDIVKYSKSHKNDVGVHMDWIVVTLLLSIIILVPLYILTVWEKRQYLTTEFKLANNLYNQQATYR